MKGGGNPGGGCQDGLVRWDELLSEGDGNKNSSLFYRDPVAFEKKMLFSCSLGVEINSHRAECIDSCIAIT